ncbi:uncharacterized protein LOC118191815 [Stegodyphus dumicola]|uniref:uncharacterized protein LOC118191815 n=1 Tax=Stegodyphus dumicola TaxID=202533 RepID=UPI0015AC037A|nr:uncharacterized protein LOC118191815 [Stegodyphus dumicola]
MARKISSTNLAYKLRRGQKDLLCAPAEVSEEFKKDTLLSTHLVDFKTPPRPEQPNRGKKRELMERFLFEKISADIAKEEFRPRSPPVYISTTHDHFSVPGFDPEAGLQPSFKYSLYTDTPISYWSENKKKIAGVTVPDNPTRNFNSSAKFSKPISERWDNDCEL